LGKKRDAQQFWWGNRPLGRPNCGWGDNIKMDHKEIGWFVVRMNVAGVNTSINMLVP
jgi:hypothetical protein